MKDKIYANKKQIIIISIVVVLILLITIGTIITKNNNSKNNNDVQIENEESSSTGNNFINRSNLANYINITGNITQQEGKYTYEIKLEPKEKILIENLKVEGTFTFKAKYLLNKVERAASVKLELKDIISNKDGTYSFKGEYSDDKKQFLSVELTENNYVKGIRFSNVSGDLYYTE